MHLLYLDESGDPGWPKPFGRSRTNWFVLAGLSLEDTQWKTVNEKYVKIVRKYFGRLCTDFDLKFSALASKRAVPPYDQLTGIQKLGLSNDIFDLVLTAKPVLFAIVVDKLKHKLQYGDNAHWPKILAFRFIAPRFHKFLERIDSYGIFVMDEEERKSDKKLKGLVRHAKEAGIVLQTPFDPFRTDTHLKRIVESVLFVPSEDSPGIPLADFCSHAIWIHFERNLSKRFNQIKQLFDSHDGNVYGLKTWP